MPTETIVVATAEPVSLQEAKTHLRVTSTSDDSRIRGLLKSAREWVENETRRKLCSQTLALYLDRFPCYLLELPDGPVQSLTSIVYFDETNSPRTLSTSDYEVDKKSTPARIAPVFGAVWPLTYPRFNAITVTFVVGYTAIPESARTGILLKLQELYDGIDVAQTIESILSPLSPVL